MHYSNFDPVVRSLVAGVVCKKCQATAAEKVRGRDWFTCRTCELKLPMQARAPATNRSQRCQNCTLQKEHGVQTCTKCGAKIKGSRQENSKRWCSSCGSA
eukprot:191109-Amphidinium_carterae.1